eukprot:6198775-Pleurochrysis_carterae.AAC.4
MMREYAGTCCLDRVIGSRISASRPRVSATTRLWIRSLGTYACTDKARVAKRSLDSPCISSRVAYEM